MSNQKESNAFFISLVISLSQAVMMQLGKITNPVSGKVEKDINQAKMSIDMMIMLKEKTKGNLTKEEEVILGDALANLQLNYVEEVKRDASASANTAPPENEKTVN
jgi:hypothetical protein